MEYLPESSVVADGANEKLIQLVPHTFSAVGNDGHSAQIIAFYLVDISVAGYKKTNEL